MIYEVIRFEYLSETYAKNCGEYLYISFTQIFIVDTPLLYFPGLAEYLFSCQAIGSRRKAWCRLQCSKVPVRAYTIAADTAAS